ncbi:unnamed protein product [Prunus armeniaca]|uniref:Uncharacterized protein n=1 Tax=Prunus armeniaca TaxID=36596 RepID=A0A6J5XBL4_PRUAR|nr:unnamed protein product [Prunus armeniaca]
MSLGASTSPPLTERRARCIPDKDITLVFIYRKEWEGKEGSTPEWSCGNKQTEDRNWGLSHFPFTVFFASTKDGHFDDVDDGKITLQKLVSSATK